MSYKRNSTTSPQSVRAAQIESEAMKLRAQGFSYDEIAEKMRISRGQAATAVRRALKRHRDETKESAREIVDLELYRLDQLFFHSMRHIKAGDLQGVAQALKVMERRSRMLGLDAATKAEISTGPAELELEKLTTEQLVKLQELIEDASSSDDEINLNEEVDYEVEPEPTDAN